MMSSVEKKSTVIDLSTQTVHQSIQVRLSRMKEMKVDKERSQE